MDINYELYKVFYHVATAKSFSGASKRLFISQSAVSQSVKTLEKKLNKTLFIRNTKKVELTPEGELLLRHIEPAINFIQKGEMQLSETSVNGGQIRIGASDTICRYFLVSYLERFHNEFPNVHIKVTNATSIGCVELLQNGQVDFIVVNSPNKYLETAYTTKIVKRFQDVFVANQSFQQLRSMSISFQQLLDYPILMLDRNSTTSVFLHHVFQQYQLDLVPEVELSSNDLLIDLARIGLGIACVPNYCIPDTTKDLFVVQTKEDLPMRQLIAAYNGKLPLAHTASSFLSYFEDLSFQKF